jgi:hemerythrin
MNNNVLEYKDIPQVAMDAMNSVHQEELKIVNTLYSTILDKNKEKVSLLCRQWLDHTKAHFAKENEMMETHNFPAYHCHHGEHVDALQVLESVIDDWENSHDFDALAASITESWAQWYVNHISSMDTVTSAFIKQSIG